MSIAKKGKLSKRKGKNFEVLYGKEKADKLKKEHSNKMKGRKAHNKLDINLVELKDMLHRNLSVKEISKYFQCSEVTIYNRIKKL